MPQPAEAISLPSARTSVVDYLLSEDSLTRADLTELTEAETDKIRDIDSAFDDFPDLPDIQTILMSRRRSIVETARGRRGHMIQTLFTDTSKVIGPPRERPRFSFFRRREPSPDDDFPGRLD